MGEAERQRDTAQRARTGIQRTAPPAAPARYRTGGTEHDPRVERKDRADRG